MKDGGWSRDRHRGALTLACFSAVGVVGLASGVAGPTLSGLADQAGVAMARIGLVITARSIGYLVGALSGGLWVDRPTAFRILGGVLLVSAASLGGMSWAGSWWLLLSMMGFLGWAMGGLDVAGNSLVLRLHRESPAPYLHALHLFYGLGGLVAPFVAGLLVGPLGGVGWTYRVLALLPLPFVWVLFRAPVDSAADSAPLPTEEGVSGRIRPAFVIGAGFYLFYVGGQIALVSWLFPFVESFSTSSSATWITGAFWASFSLFRLLGIPLSRRWSPARILVLDFAVLILAGLPLLLWRESLVAAWVGALGMGAGHASIYASGVLLLSRRAPLTGPRVGLVVAFSCIGSMIFPWLMGVLFARVGPVAVPALSTALMGLAFGTAAWILWGSTWNKTPSEKGESGLR